jgi:hypothetical protein
MFADFEIVLQHKYIPSFIMCSLEKKTTNKRENVHL